MDLVGKPETRRQGDDNFKLILKKQDEMASIVSVSLYREKCKVMKSSFWVP
jgi:hypothetical protein